MTSALHSLPGLERYEEWGWLWWMVVGSWSSTCAWLWKKFTSDFFGLFGFWHLPTWRGPSSGFLVTVLLLLLLHQSVLMLQMCASSEWWACVHDCCNWSWAKHVCLLSFQVPPKVLGWDLFRDRCALKTSQNNSRGHFASMLHICCVVVLTTNTFLQAVSTCGWGKAQTKPT